MSEKFPRILREKYHFTPNIIKLQDVKNYFYLHSQIPIEQIGEKYFTDRKCSKILHEKLCYYLHFLIMFKTTLEINKFLENHTSIYGSYATKMLVNYPLVNLYDKNIITPLMCCMLWSDNIDILRCLYSWGIDVSQFDVYGRYSEELYSHISYYTNHMSDYLCPKTIFLGIRLKKDFMHMAYELYYLGEESKYPNNWTRPIRKI